MNDFFGGVLVGAVIMFFIFAIPFDKTVDERNHYKSILIDIGYLAYDQDSKEYKIKVKGENCE